MGRGEGCCDNWIINDEQIPNFWETLVAPVAVAAPRMMKNGGVAPDEGEVPFDENLASRGNAPTTKKSSPVQSQDRTNPRIRNLVSIYPSNSPEEHRPMTFTQPLERAD